MTAASLLRGAVSGAIIAALGVVFAISFSAIIYGGSAAPGLSRGIGLGLLGTVVMATVAAFRLTYRDTIVQPQDVTAVILSLAVAEDRRRLAGLPRRAPRHRRRARRRHHRLHRRRRPGLCGRLRLGFLVRFVPYPLIGGFLAATGYLIVLGAIGMTLHRSVTIWTLGPLLDPANLALLAPLDRRRRAPRLPAQALPEHLHPARRHPRPPRRLLPRPPPHRHRPRDRPRRAASSSAPSARRASSPASTPRASARSPGPRSSPSSPPCSPSPPWRSSAACSTPPASRSPPAARSTPTASSAAPASPTSPRRPSAASSASPSSA